MYNKQRLRTYHFCWREQCIVLGKGLTWSDKATGSCRLPQALIPLSQKSPGLPEANIFTRYPNASWKIHPEGEAHLSHHGEGQSLDVASACTAHTLLSQGHPLGIERCMSDYLRKSSFDQVLKQQYSHQGFRPPKTISAHTYRAFHFLLIWGPRLSLSWLFCTILMPTYL